jgi:hypothetical protein
VKLFVVIRDETGLRRVDAFKEEEAAKADEAKAAGALHDLEVHEAIGSDLRDVLHSHPSWFEEAA